MPRHVLHLENLDFVPWYTQKPAVFGKSENHPGFQSGSQIISKKASEFDGMLILLIPYHSHDHNFS
jgi:hypothetical protein